MSTFEFFISNLFCQTLSCHFWDFSINKKQPPIVSPHLCRLEIEKYMRVLICKILKWIYCPQNYFSELTNVFVQFQTSWKKSSILLSSIDTATLSPPMSSSPLWACSRIKMLKKFNWDNLSIVLLLYSFLHDCLL